MSTSILVPVSISPEARAFIDNLRQRTEFQTMLEQARTVVTGLTSIDVVLDQATEDIPAGVVLWAHREGVKAEDDPTHRDWIDWMTSTFPPDILRNFTLLSVYHDDER